MRPLRSLHTIVCQHLGISINSPLSTSILTPSSSILSFYRHNSKTITTSTPSQLTDEQYQAALDKINDKFVEARDEIEYAEEDAETTYFNESYQQAKELVDDVLKEYHGLLDVLSEGERGKLQRSMGMKMEQLKAELDRLDTLHD